MTQYITPDDAVLDLMADAMIDPTLRDAKASQTPSGRPIRRKVLQRALEAAHSAGWMMLPIKIRTVQPGSEESGALRALALDVLPRAVPDFKVQSVDERPAHLPLRGEQDAYSALPKPVTHSPQEDAFLASLVPGGRLPSGPRGLPKGFGMGRVSDGGQHQEGESLTPWND